MRVSGKLAFFVLVAFFTLGPALTVAWGPSIHIDGITVRPLEPIPVRPTGVDTAEQKAEQDAAAKAAEAAKAAAAASATAAKAAADAAAAAAKAQAAIPIAEARVITGQESVGQGARDAIEAQGLALEKTGQAASTATEQAENVQITVAQSIAGDPGKTVMTLATGPTRLQEEFASTLVIQSGQVLQGANAAHLIAAPLAAALRAAKSQFSPQSRPVPDAVRQQLAGFYTAAELNNARYAIGSVSISVPDLVNKERKVFEGTENAVTVGNVMVFSVDPGDNYHWWAHELQHTNQYTQWGIDDFAYRYVTSCHQVEKDAEDHAQKAIPFAVPAQLSC